MKSPRSDWRATVLVIVGAAVLLLGFVLSANLEGAHDKGSQDDGVPSIGRPSVTDAVGRAGHRPEGRAEYMDKYKAQYIAKQKAQSKAREGQK